MIRQEALSKGFAVAGFAADFDSSALHRPKPVLRAIARSLEFPERPEIGLTPLLRNLAATKRFRADVSALYESWADPRASQRHFDSFSFWPPALRAYIESPAGGDPLLRWMGGGDILIATARRRILDSSLQTPRRMAVTARELPYILLGLANSIHWLGYAGLIVLIDELENGLSDRATPTQRRAGVNLLAQLGRGRGALMIVGAVTPAVYATLRDDSLHWDGARLWKREFDEVVRRLKGDAPLRIDELASEDLVRLGERVISIHEKAFGWSVDGQLTHDSLAQLAREAHAGHRPVRGYVRTLVELLELCEQDRRLRVAPPRSEN
jgi:hypothetical protein